MITNYASSTYSVLSRNYDRWKHCIHKQKEYVSLDYHPSGNFIVYAKLSLLLPYNLHVYILNGLNKGTSNEIPSQIVNKHRFDTSDVHKKNDGNK